MTAPNSHGIPLRPLGKTGVSVTAICLGGGHCARPGIEEATTVKVVQAAIDGGITMLDNAWEYANGESERRFGLALDRARRDKVVLMTKVCGRDRKTAEANLEDSLRRMKTDRIDLWQFHECNYDNDHELIFAKGGAIEAAVAAQKAGKVRFIGFTGHKSPHIMANMLATGFPWDACQFPLNIMDFHYRSFERETLPAVNKAGIGSLGMKSLGGEGQMVKAAGFTAEECRKYVLSLPVSSLVVGVESMKDLEQEFRIARGFVPYTAAEMDVLRARARPQAGDGRHEWFKSTQFFDSQVHRDQHGFPPIGSVG